MSIELHGPVWAWLLIWPWGSFIAGFVFAALVDTLKWWKRKERK